MAQSVMAINERIICQRSASTWSKKPISASGLSGLVLPNMGANVEELRSKILFIPILKNQQRPNTGVGITGAGGK